jgi:hypothetical protein
LSEIKTFLKERGDKKAELEDEEWLFDLAFLSDFTGKLSDMHLELQGKNKLIAEIMSTDSSYKSKFELMDLTKTLLITFLICRTIWKKHPNFVFQTEKYVTKICSVIQYFLNRFCDF